MPAGRNVMLTRRKVVASGVGVAAGLAVAACNHPAKEPSKVSWTEPGAGPSPSATTGVPLVTITPAADAKSVPPRDPIVVSVTGGTLKTCTVTTGSQRVAGTMSDDHTWRSTGALGYGKTYHVTVSTADAAGAVTEKTSAFTTLKPGSVASISFQANDLAALKTGGTYGVGQPVIVHFSKTVKDRAAAVKGLEVTTSPPVEGRWRWTDSRTAHWRPAKYWAPGTKITVKADLLGTNLGGGVYGANASTHFTIGPSRIAVADGKSHRMKVYINGKQVKDMPISMGKGGIVNGVNYWTRSGVHVVMTKEPVHHMTSASYGVDNPKDPNFYDEDIKLCCRISYSGEFVHMADWNIYAHGHSNTSHGCVNVGPGNARWFFDNFQLGDVVEIRNTPRQMGLNDGVGDWTIPWDKW
jgi:lipoprotein-anchoring transpeptidase ErfK/SrfK